jgi:hypothetical protein
MARVYAIVPLPCSQSAPAEHQKIARAFGGDPTSPGILRGVEVKRKLYLFVFLQWAESALRSHSSPMLTPNMDNSHG